MFLMLFEQGRTPVADRDFKVRFGDLVLVENLRYEANKSDVRRSPFVYANICCKPPY